MSIIVPCYNEAESIQELYKEITDALAPLNKSYELMFVDDGSTDSTFEIIRNLHYHDSRVRCIQFRRNFGKSDALSAGFRNTRGFVVITMDADLQDDPKEIPRFLEALRGEYDVVSGWKYPRRDPIGKRLPSKVINGITGLLTGIRIHDMNCGFKAYRRQVVQDLSLYGEQYRFIPVLVNQKGFRVGEIKVHHRPRQFGMTKFGVKRLLTGFFDLLTVLFLSRFVSKPLHIFGILGMIILAVGTGIVGYILHLRILFGSIMSRHPLLIGGVMLVITGLQFISTGLIAEMIVVHANNPERERYSIKNKI